MDEDAGADGALGGEVKGVPEVEQEVAARAALALDLCATDTITKPPPHVHETRRLSCDREDDIDAKWHREDAIAATTSR